MRTLEELCRSRQALREQRYAQAVCGSMYQFFEFLAHHAVRTWFLEYSC